MFGCNKSAWVGAVPEAATPALAWPPSLCSCPLRRRATRLSGCSVRGDVLGSRGRRQGGERGRPAGPPNTKSRSRGRHADCAELRAGFFLSTRPGQGGTGQAGQVPGPWRAGLARRRPGAASRCPLAAARQGSQGPWAPAVSLLSWAAAPRSAACFVF